MMAECVPMSDSIEIFQNGLLIVQAYPDSYPQDEISWLMLNCWNNQCVFDARGDYESAHRSYEIALSLSVYLQVVDETVKHIRAHVTDIPTR